MKKIIVLIIGGITFYILEGVYQVKEHAYYYLLGTFVGLLID